MDFKYIHLRLGPVVQFNHVVTRSQHLPSPKKRTGVAEQANSDVAVLPALSAGKI